ncbi:outer membrane beta-barrel protein [Sphingobacterium chuzhouense]|uniref:Outer membrane beta-barrel protein n=1 Tax=Sphingobacterium chuzhouense TaxID=1742264 RepID=A0ABR7XM77_9SPHI|nr:outer membrane beta-barrel protein [Sphingobacterium chuzhouense]MBD1420281.1 outer membrane beta-barrel protein [Sphingobacterium chuzhouense]
MKRLSILFFTLFFLGCFTHLRAQTTITGKVLDESDQTSLVNATIMLLQAKDSILIAHTRAGENGGFKLLKPDTIPYLVIVSYPKYGDYFKHIGDDGDVNLGDVKLTSISHLIEEVIVTGKIPVVIKGDTTEYDASSFVVEKNAKVEDLLKVLPGISVDADGKITAQGKTVEKVLVDGEEFFGDDPTLVTRNIRSDMVDKVQLYEKKSEETERTGVDDGQRIQTINVKLKEDAKKGMFGKVEGAGGTDDFYLGKLALNKFNGSQKIGAYLMGANDGNLSLNWQEAEKFGMSSMETGMTDGGDMYMIYSGDSFDRWDGKGRPEALSTGVSFLDAWKENKHKLNGSYKYGMIQNDVVESSLSRNSLPGNEELNTSSTSTRETDARRHRFNTKYDLKIDSLTTLTINLSASKGKSESNSRTEASSWDENGDFVNSNDRTESSISDNTDFNYRGYLTRRFKKTGRSASFRFGGNVSDNKGSGFLNSTLDTLDNSGNIVSVPTDQQKEIDRQSNSITTSLTYTEPITSKLNSSVGYEYNMSRAHAINTSYNKDDDGNYTDFDEVFSSDFNFNTIRNAVNVALNYKLEKFEANFTNNFRNDDMFQQNNYEDLSASRDFFTYNPSARLRYNFRGNRTVGFHYNHSNTLPSLSQIQPLRQNQDPLNIVVGNEDLTPARNDRYNMYYSNYNMMKGTNLYVDLEWRQTRNAIQQNVMIENGVRTLFYENLDGYVANNGRIWLGGGFDVSKKIQLKARISGNGSYNNYYNYINSQLNENTNYDYSFGLNLSKNTTKNIDFNIGFYPGWRLMETSLQPELNSSGFVYNTNVWYSWKLPWKLSFYGNMTYNYEAPTKALNEKFELLLFKPGISKKFLKDESLVVDFYVNDIFNQNKGFRRFQSGSAISQNTYNTISRYFMLKVSWDFTSMKGGKE